MCLSDGTNSPIWSKQNDLQPISLGIGLQDKLEEKELQREEASSQIFHLKRLLEDVEDEIYTLENEMETERSAFIKQVHDVFFDYLPGHGHNYSHTIGPIDWDIVENDERIGDIDIGEIVGINDRASGSVYIGTHRTTKEQFAVKTLIKEHYADLSLLLMLEKEIDVHSLLMHPNIIKLERVIHSPKHIYIIMELAYMDLNSYLCLYKDCLSLDMVREVLIGVLQGLKYLHKQGVAHLDLKQHHILVSSNVAIHELTRDCIKISHFRCCEVHPHSGNPVPVYRKVGTPGFMAPEILADVTTADGRAADMWSLGAMLLWIVEGELNDAWMNAYSYKDDNLKYEDDIIQCLIDLHGRQQNSVDLELYDLTRKLLVIVPSHRLTAIQALGHPWLRLSEQGIDEVRAAWNRKHRNTM
jgi:serine/threonine protein kinase